MPAWADQMLTWLNEQAQRLDQLESSIVGLSQNLESRFAITEAKLDADDVRIDLLIKRVEALEKSPPAPGPSPEPPPPPAFEYGPRFPVGPQDSITLPDPHIVMRPGDSLSKIYAAPAGMAFVFEPGVYNFGTTIWIGTNKSGWSFIGKKGAVIDGGGTTGIAFNTGSTPAKDITIHNLEIRNFTSGLAAILGHKAEGWSITNCDIHHNATAGIRVGAASVLVARNRIHHNGRIGIVASFGSDGVIEDNEIYANNYENQFPQEGPTAEAGGTKFTNTQNLIVRYNHSYDNQGVGLWTDIDNIHTLYEWNRCEDNSMEGIFHEISYDAVIRNNLCEENGHNHGWFYGGGITIAHSQNVEVHDNVVRGNRCGITGTDECRGTGAYGEYRLQNVHIHDNDIFMATGGEWAAGFATTCGRPVWDSGNRYERNRYHLFVPSMFANLNQARVDFGIWQSMGQDLQGTCEVT